MPVMTEITVVIDQLSSESSIFGKMSVNHFLLGIEKKSILGFDTAHLPVGAFYVETQTVFLHRAQLLRKRERPGAKYAPGLSFFLV